MANYPNWLPGIVPLSGDKNSDTKLLYTIFENDIKSGGLKYQNMPIWYDRRIRISDGYEEAFWHLITKEDTKVKNRFFDSKRAERLTWLAPVVKNADKSPEVLCWRSIHRKGIRLYLWLRKHDYIVIFHEAKSGRVLITAYYIEGKSTQRKFLENFNNRIP